ncbi:probable serine hydrolase [Orussus abietinus]|uniref:probable serine hydrolase n=1 Tax=Orussus abietinus TaxID=222816 RepID=UPI000626B9A5|nr:probable serine hydrolase [Orussus abietinus]
MTRRMFCRKVELASKEAAEVEIPVPWGRIAEYVGITAAKWWGPKDKQPILTFHGWQDNAGSFDHLAPLLNSPILAIDLPGHGFSSWLPTGILYSEMIHVILIYRIKEYFGWKDVRLLGHSWGCMFHFYYASLYPDHTKFVISIDALKYESRHVPEHSQALANGIPKLLAVENQRTPPPSYSEADLMKRWIEATNNSIDEKACKTLMIRGARKLKNGSYVFSRDPILKLRFVYAGYTHDHLRQIANLIRNPYLVVKAEGLQLIESDENFYDIANILKTTCSEFRLECLPGTHHLHMLQPKRVADVINSFLEKHNT